MIASPALLPQFYGVEIEPITPTTVIPEEHLSPSQIKSFAYCQASYYLDRIARIPSLSMMKTIRGTLAHQALETLARDDHKQLCEAVADGSLEGFLADYPSLSDEHLAAVLRESAQHGVVYEPSYHGASVSSMEDLFADARHAVALIARNVLSRLQPIAVECGFILRWLGNPDVPCLVTYSDLIAIQPDIGLSVIDYKTSTKAKTLFDLVADPAIPVYLAYARALYGEDLGPVQRAEYVNTVYGPQLSLSRIVWPVTNASIDDGLRRVFSATVALARANAARSYTPSLSYYQCRRCLQAPHCADTFGPQPAEFGDLVPF